MNETTQSVNELHDKVISEAVSNEAFRTKLTADPKAALKEELGVHIPDNLKVHVHETTNSAIHLVLPQTDALSEKELAQISAGKCLNEHTSVFECAWRPDRW